MYFCSAFRGPLSTRMQNRSCFFLSCQMGNNHHSERCVIQEVKKASEQSCVGEIGLQHAFLLSSSG